MDDQYKALINRYIKAKDANKPHLMKGVFSKDAILEMKVESQNISFPAAVNGLNEITETLIREFNKTYENIYTICITDTLEQGENALNCRWLVGMTEKVSGLSKVGFGDYQWTFESRGENLASRLTIIIENMTVLPEEFQPDVAAWFDSLTYPWALSSEVLSSIPDIALLTEVRSNIV